MRLKTLGLIVTLALGILAGTLTAETRAQQPARVHQIGYLISGSPAFWANRVEPGRSQPRRARSSQRGSIRSGI